MPSLTRPDWSTRLRTARTARGCSTSRPSGQARKDVSAVGGGFTARKDIKATDANATELDELIEDVEIFEPDWSDIGTNLDGYIDAWKAATGN